MNSIKTIGFFLVIALLIITPVVLSCVAIVPTGHTGIITTFGRVESRVLDSGLNFKSPFQKVVKMDNRTQKVSIEMSAFSSDIQQVDILLSVNYEIDRESAFELYKSVGKKYYETIVLPRLLESVKSVFAKHTAEELITRRDVLSSEAFDFMNADLEKHGVILVSVNIEDIDFTDAFTDAVEAKQVAAQNKLTAETEEARKTMETEAEAQREVIKAQAELEVAKIDADAKLYASEKEAEANKKLGASITTELLEYYKNQRWNGELPETVLGDTVPFMTIQ